MPTCMVSLQCEFWHDLVNATTCRMTFHSTCKEIFLVLWCSSCLLWWPWMSTGIDCGISWHSSNNHGCTASAGNTGSSSGGTPTFPPSLLPVGFFSSGWLRFCGTSRLDDRDGVFFGKSMMVHLKAEHGAVKFSILVFINSSTLTIYREASGGGTDPYSQHWDDQNS